MFSSLFYIRYVISVKKELFRSLEFFRFWDQNWDTNHERVKIDDSFETLMNLLSWSMTTNFLRSGFEFVTADIFFLLHVNISEII